jgi:hypothetical protein
MAIDRRRFSTSSGIGRSATGRSIGEQVFAGPGCEEMAKKANTGQTILRLAEAFAWVAAPAQAHGSGGGGSSN